MLVVAVVTDSKRREIKSGIGNDFGFRLGLELGSGRAVVGREESTTHGSVWLHHMELVVKKRKCERERERASDRKKKKIESLEVN